MTMNRHYVIQPENQSIKIIPLTQMQNALVDASDYDSLNRWSWCAAWIPSVRGYYAVRRDRNKTVYMHRQIIGCLVGMECDHINHNSLDNRRENLRMCTTAENQHNQRISKSNTTGHKGVSFYSSTGKWRAYIKVKGKFKHLGWFHDLESAANSYSEAARKLFGEFANLDSRRS